MDNNIYLNFLKTGWCLHADIMILLHKKYIEPNCDKNDFVFYAENKFGLDAVCAVLIWQSFDVYEGFLLSSRSNND